MLSFLGLGKIQIAVAAALLMAIVGLSLALWFVRGERDTLLENNAKLDIALKVQEATIDAALDNVQEWRLAFEGLQANIKELSRVQEKAGEESRRLNDIFSKHDLEALARRKPGLIENRIQRGVDNTWRLLNDITAGRAGGTPGSGEASGETDPP